MDAQPDPARRNVELKAIDPEPERSLAVCRSLGAEDRGVLVQRDTYFAVAQGGLKLREQTPGTPHLIQFEREDRPEQRLSRYRVIGVDDGPADPCGAVGRARGPDGRGEAPAATPRSSPRFGRKKTQHACFPHRRPAAPGHRPEPVGIVPPRSPGTIGRCRSRISPAASSGGVTPS